SKACDRALAAHDKQIFGKAADLDHAIEQALGPLYAISQPLTARIGNLRRVLEGERAEPLAEPRAPHGDPAQEPDHEEAAPSAVSIGHARRVVIHHHQPPQDDHSPRPSHGAGGAKLDADGVHKAVRDFANHWKRPTTLDELR